jgi:hypothetical protein
LVHCRLDAYFWNRYVTGQIGSGLMSFECTVIGLDSTRIITRGMPLISPFLPFRRDRADVLIVLLLSPELIRASYAGKYCGQYQDLG